MKKLFLTAMIIILWSCKQDNKETSDVALNLEQYTIEQFMDNEAVGGGSFSSDNSKLLISSNRSGIYNMYTIPSSGGEMTPITTSDSSSIFALSYFPNDDRMLYRADGNGDEIYHLYLRDLDGTTKELTPDEGARAGFYGWAHDGNSFYYRSNKRNPQYMDVYEMDIETFDSNLIYQNNDGLDVNAISYDKNTLALLKPVNTNDTDLYLYSISDKKMTKINENLSGNSAQDFSLDGKDFYYTTDEGSEFSYVMK